MLMHSSMVVLLKACLLSFVRAFLATLIVLLPGVAMAPNFNLAKAAAIAALVAAVTSGLRAVQALLTKVEPTDAAVS